MTGLVDVADGLYAQDDYSFLPASVVAWGGYVGKPSINAWTADQVAHLESTGRLWLPIWTPGDGTTYTRAEAVTDAAAMLAGLHALGITDQRWIFLDIEHSRWVNTPAQTEDAAGYWCQIMRSSGWPRAGWYGPWGSSAPWRANWTGTRPDTLPPGVLGWQYDHALAGDRYDISVFDPQILDRTGGSDVMSQPTEWSDQSWQKFRNEVAATGSSAGLGLYEQAKKGADDAAAALAAIAALSAKVDKIIAGQGPAGYHGTVSLTPGP